MIRIRGAVRIAKQVKISLKVGIPPAEVESFRQFVRRSVQDIERLCYQAQASPAQLPTPSHHAYLFLKHLDLDNLPLSHSSPFPPPSPPASPPPVLRLKNVLKQQQSLQQQLGQIAASHEGCQAEKQSLFARLQAYVGEIEQICSDRGLTPAALAAPSRRAYAWMKFLTLDGNLEQHLITMQQVTAIGQAFLSQRRQSEEKLSVELTHCAALYRCRQIKALTTLQLSEGFLAADREVLTAVIKTALQGKTATTRQIIHNFALSEEYSEIILELDLIADVEADTPQGACYDLEALFAEVNQRYFAGKLDKPRLTWNGRLANRKFGHYEPARDLVVISQTLDACRIPPCVPAFVLYHELLHKQHGSRWVEGKRLVHTPTFRQDERRFEQYDVAQDWLNRLARDM
jgi:hypothetical protein